MLAAPKQEVMQYFDQVDEYTKWHRSQGVDINLSIMSKFADRRPQTADR